MQTWYVADTDAAIKNSTSLHEGQKQDRITVNRWIRICKDVAQPVLRIHEF
jgi:hypothetical protein